MTAWTPEDDEIAKGHWINGESASEIARRLPGRTRNAVIGRIYRLGLSCEGRANPQVTRAPKAPVVRPVAKRQPPKPGPQGRVAVVMGVPFPVVPPDEMDRLRAAASAKGRTAISKLGDEPTDTAIPLIGRRFGQCAWPVGTPERPGEQLCCGAATTSLVEGSPYCTGHAQRAYQRDITQPKPSSDRLGRLARAA